MKFVLKQLGFMPAITAREPLSVQGFAWNADLAGLKERGVYPLTERYSSEMFIFYTSALNGLSQDQAINRKH